MDDEPLARDRLVRLLEDVADCHIVGEAENGEQAIAACNKYKPDVVLMDIRMPVMDGLIAAQHLAVAEDPPAVIFCTAYDDYALSAFEANAVDYLLKPVNRDKLKNALDKAKKLNRVQLLSLTNGAVDASELSSKAHAGRRHISCKSSKGIELIAIEDIRYFLADKKYVSVYFCHEGELSEQLIDEPLKDLEREFPDQFVRVHRNALVALNYVVGLERADNGSRLKLDGVDQGPLISRRHLAEIRKLLVSL